MELNLKSYIDHTQLKPDTTKAEIKQLLAEAKTYEFASVCVNPHWVTYCSDHLVDSAVKTCTVIGFPLGATSTKTKVFETEQAISDGADEIDMVINIGELKGNNLEFVEQDIRAVVLAAKSNLVKVIIETSLLTKEEKIIASQLAKKAGAHYVKTSTGFSGGGATIEDIKLMRQTVGNEMGIKASGGIRDLEKVKGMINAGATRIGASAGVSIMKEIN